MRVGISATSYMSGLKDGHNDGIGVYTGSLLASLADITNVDVKGFFWGEGLESVRLPSSYSSVKLKSPYLVSGFFSHGFGLADLNSHLISGQVDVFHCTDYKIPKLTSVPVVATLHDAVPIQNPDWVTPRLRRIKNKVLTNSMNWLDHVVTISDYVVDDVVRYWGVDRDNVSVVYNGVDEYWFHAQSESHITDVLSKFNITKSYALFVGTFQPRKNIDRLVDAYLSLPENYRRDHLLVLAGRVGWGCEDLHVKINKLVQKGQCIRIQNASDDEIRCLYQGARAFLFPSLYEGFGLPVLEAFASRVPVITSKNTALEEVAGDAAFLIDPYSAEDIADKLKYVLDLDMDARLKGGEKGAERARQFSWENTALQLYDIYKSLV